ncbi:MAG: lysophospholipid acyltransferase family protein [Bacteroidetes bacterium]|nr:lysophospholipid acyltransferase family protein [Bacteroidota bacterium]
MSALLYYIALPFIYLLSMLPFWWLQRLADGLHFLLYAVLGYRKKVVLGNLRNSFPNKSEKEIEAIAKRFYLFFCDLILETLKTLTISNKTLRQRVKLDVSLFEKFAAEGRSVILVMGHFGNWELTGASFAQVPLHRLYIIYHPLKNKYFNRLTYYMRTRLGNRLYEMNNVMRGMLGNRAQLTATAFIADQTPSAPATAYWTKFLNQDTPIFNGTAKIAKKLNYPIIYASTTQPKRGYYDVKCELLIDRRWKHKKPTQ